MATISEALAMAVQHHQAGRLQEAEEIYRRILEVEPNYVDAIHLLGVMASQVGQLETASQYIGRAIALKGDAAEFHHNLANVHLASRRIPEAAASSRRAIALAPNYAEAHDGLGNALKAEGKIEEAIACFRRALALAPDFPGGLNNLGGVLKEAGKLEEAAACFRRALALAPGLPEAHSNLGVTLEEQGKLEEAVDSLRRALVLRPEYVEAHNNLGVALEKLGNRDEAMACFRRALELAPHFAEAHNNLGNAYKEKGKLEEAAVCFHRALELTPNYAEACNNMANAAMELGQVEEAIGWYRRSLELKQESAVPRVNLAVALLLLGRYEEGWALYESRRAVLPRRDFAAPRWHGELAEGSTILLHCEQGFGDALHFMRYPALLRERAKAGRLIVEAPPPLVRLLTHSFRGEIEVIAPENGDEARARAYDWHLPLLSLPLALGICEPPPSSGPYLHADAELRAIWRARMGLKEGLRVGLAWKGNPTQARDRFRSVSGERFLRLVTSAGATFYSLQVDEGGADALALREAGLIDLTSEITDFADTAAIMAELDLIIAVDTAVVHLAGALGRPIWTLLTFVPHWPWGLSGETTPWYPTMRLFRQPSRDDWHTVLDQVRAALLDLGGN